MSRIRTILAEEGLLKEASKNGYVAFYKGKRTEVQANTSLEARDLAAKFFKARKPHEVTVVLAEKGGKQVTHLPLMASTKIAGATGTADFDMRRGEAFLATYVAPHGIFAGGLDRPAARGRREIGKFLDNALEEVGGSWAWTQKAALLDIKERFGYQSIALKEQVTFTVDSEREEELRAALTKWARPLGFTVGLDY